MGTKGEIQEHMERGELEIKWFGTNETKIIPLNQDERGHGGGDHGII